MRIGTILGIPVLVNWFFLLLLLGLAMAGMLVETMLMFTLVFFHELAHVLTAKRHGLSIKEIELFPFGGVAKLEDVLELDPEIERNVALAGPLFNFILAGLGTVMYFNNLWVGEGLNFFIQGNLMLGCFNLLPALPLDGGRVLRAKLGEKKGFRFATEKVIILGKILSTLLFCAGVYLFFLGSVNVSLLLMPLFMLLAAGREKNMMLYHFIRHLARKEEEFNDKGVMQASFLISKDDISAAQIFKHFMPKCYHCILVIDSSKKLLGQVTESELIKGVLDKGIGFKIKDLLK